RELAEREQVVRLEQREPVVEVEPLAGLHLLADEIERRIDKDRHQLARSTTAYVRLSSSSRRVSPPRYERAFAAYSSAAPRDRSSASVAATRASAPSSGPPASAARTVSSPCAAYRSGIVGVPSRRSLPGIFPVSCVC